jgi:tetratricopeptide (TPR) repeat protein
MRTRSQWHSLPLQLAQFEWGIPPQAVLDDAVAFRRALDKQRDNDLAAFADKLLLVVGSAATTPAGYEASAKDGRGVVYLDAANRGDGRVTLENAELPGVATWAVDVDHGSLPRYRAAFEGYRELLNTGNTKLLRQVVTTDTVRGRAAEPGTQSRPARLSSSSQSPPESELDVLSSRAAPALSSAPPAQSLRINIANGDLTYTSEPLLIGHYRSSRLTGAEAAMNRALEGAMSASLQRGLYPMIPGTHQIFRNVTTNPDNPWQLPRPEAVIVAGLGPEGELRGSEIVNTVRQAVIGWAQRLTEDRQIPAGFTLATTLIGSGGTGITAGQSAQLIAQGVREANDQLAEDGTLPPRWPRVDQLKIIELYLDRANEAWNALQALAASAPGHYSVGPIIAQEAGSRRRPAEAGYRGADYDFVSALVLKTEDDIDEIGYTINSKRARNEVRPQPMQVRLISNLVITASNDVSTDTQIGRTLFNLLVPADLEGFLGDSTETVLELDEGTAGIPWEILESPTTSGRRKPWSIRTKLLRKLRTATPTIVVNNATADDGILVIGDPACERSIYPRLMGARREATQVADSLTQVTSQAADSQGSARAQVTSLISGPNSGDPEPDATTIVNAAFQRSWRIIHVAGHGEPPTANGKRIDTRGVVLSGGLFLGPQEIAALRVKPELVFVNCCHLAADDPNRLLKASYDRAQFAAGVAHALIKSGVRCVVAAGWAVDDEAASVFAKAFYTALVGGARFIDAVAIAREQAHACGGNTWAAYQCYGDPDWRFRPATGDAQRPATSPGPEFANIASAPSLILALEQIAVESENPGKPADVQAGRLRYLETTFGLYRDRGDVAEAFGNAWSKSGRFAEAIDWYERARQAPDGTASLTAIEQLANLRIRNAWNSIKDERTRSPAAIEQARTEIHDAMSLLDTLRALAPTFERENIHGSGFKRLAMLEAAAGRDEDERKAIRQMLKHYGAAEEIARTTGIQPFFYPAMSRIAAQLVLANSAQPLDTDYVESVRGSMSSAQPDFWSVVGQTELDVLVSIADHRLAHDVEAVIEDFRKLHRQVSNPRMWGSVLDSATFALSRYRNHSKADERAAADRLLGELESMAAVTAQAAPQDEVAAKPLRKPQPAGTERPARARRSGGSRRKKTRNTRTARS